MNRVNSNIIKSKKELELRLMCSINYNTIQKIKHRQFPRPCRSWLSHQKASLKEETLSVSTVDSDSRDLASNPKSLITDKADKLFISQRLAAGDKKVKTMIHKMLRFEESCIINSRLNKQKVSELMESSRGYLGLILSHYDDFRFQHAESMSLAILLLSSIKVGLSKKQFLRSASSITSKNLKKLEVIRKARCYSMIKQLSRV